MKKYLLIFILVNLGMNNSFGQIEKVDSLRNCLDSVGRIAEFFEIYSGEKLDSLQNRLEYYRSIGENNSKKIERINKEKLRILKRRNEILSQQISLKSQIIILERSGFNMPSNYTPPASESEKEFVESESIL